MKQLQLRNFPGASKSLHGSNTHCASCKSFSLRQEGGCQKGDPLPFRVKHCSKLATSLPAADSKLIWSQAAKLRGGTARLPKTPHSQGDKLTWKELLTPQDIPSFKAEIPWRPARGILLASHHQRGPGQSLAHRQQAFQSLLRTCEASGFSQVILPARCHLLASPVHGLG